MTLCHPIKRKHDTLIWQDATRRQYFAEQTFYAEISRAEVCTHNLHAANALRTFHTGLCNDRAWDVAFRATSWRTKHGFWCRQRQPFSSQSATFRPLIGGLLEVHPWPLATRKATDGASNSHIPTFCCLFHTIKKTFHGWHFERSYRNLGDNM